jgi:hypothetical protein
LQQRRSSIRGPRYSCSYIRDLAHCAIRRRGAHEAAAEVIRGSIIAVCLEVPDFAEGVLEEGCAEEGEFCGHGWCESGESAP